MIAALSVVPLLAQSQSPEPAIPNVVHWCAQHCTTWTLDKGAPFDKPHYGNQGVGSIVIVERFTRESVIMQRTDYRPYPGRAVLKGQLSSEGNSIVNGTIEWTYHPCCGLSTGKFQAAWGTAINTVPGSDAERERITALKSAPLAAPPNPNTPGNLQPDQQPKQAPRSRIWLPPGASPQFASLPADIRAVLRPEPVTITIRVRPSCANANELKADEALEFGKYAFRATDFTLGYCLIKHSTDLGNARAKVLLGVAAMMGWGIAKDEKAAFHYFDDAAGKGDVWGTYFTEQCFEKGIGTPVNKNQVVRMNTWLTLNPRGQALFMSIGADDPEIHRQYERFMVYVNPPTTQRRVCELPRGATQEICHTEEKVNEEGLQGELNAVDRKYGK